MILDVSLDNIVQFDDTSWSYFKCNHDILAQEMQKCNQCSGEPSSRMIVAKNWLPKIYYLNRFVKIIFQKNTRQKQSPDRAFRQLWNQRRQMPKLLKSMKFVLCILCCCVFFLLVQGLPLSSSNFATTRCTRLYSICICASVICGLHLYLCLKHVDFDPCQLI